jgi:hypothetical protein
VIYLGWQQRQRPADYGYLGFGNQVKGGRLGGKDRTEDDLVADQHRYIEYCSSLCRAAPPVHDLQG